MTVTPFLVVAAASVFTLITGVAAVCYLRPSLIVQLFLMYWRRTCGMQIKFIGDGEYVFCYGERGQKSKDRSSILFIHGFTASKDMWNNYFKNLPSEYHLVAVDLPGHGASSTPPPSQDLSIHFSMDVIKRFADLVGLTDKPFHLIGASLGGCMVGMFSATFPHLVERVTMICPAMKCPEESAFSEQVNEAMRLGADHIEMEHCSLLPQTPRQLQLMMDSCIYAKPQYNTLFLKGFLDIRSPKYAYFLRVFRTMASEENVRLLEDNCHRITMPSQLIWGKHDQIIHPSGAGVLQKKLPDCRNVTLLEDCGHSVDLDRPFASCNAIIRFRGDAEPCQKSS